MLLCWVRVPWAGRSRSNDNSAEKMKRIFQLLVAVIALSCLVSCNEKPRHYQMVENMADGKQVIEKFDAENDTVALNKYIDRMAKVIMENMGDSATQAPAVESMYVISPDGDTLNTNIELMGAIENQIRSASPH